jgi:hypothetical protein
MAMMHVNRGATSLGAFPEEEVREGLRSGRFRPSDLGWREGMASWQTLSQFPEFAADIAAAPAGPPPATPTPPTQFIPAAPVSGSEVDRTGLPWENRAERGFFNAFIETLQMVLTKPDLAFRTMKVEGGLADPVSYALIGGVAGGVVAFLYSFVFQSMGLFAERRNAFAMMAGMGAGSVIFIIILPLMIVIALFIGSAVVHLCLMIVGGANKSFETTLRVLAFGQGSTGPLQMIPVCGGLIALVWALVVDCIGLARAHETETGRAVLAIFLPVIVCCGGAILLAILVPAAIHMGAH